MNEITALVQRLKAAAGDDSYPVLSPDDCRALVEALEVRRPHHNGMMQLSNELVMAKQHISELEKATTEPVAWTEKCEITNMQATGLYLRGFPDNSQGRDIALYTASPAPVVPKKIPDSVYQIVYQECGGFVDCDANAQTIWNACRAAMLNAGKLNSGIRETETAAPEQENI